MTAVAEGPRVTRMNPRKVWNLTVIALSVVIILSAALAPLLAPADPVLVDLTRRLEPPSSSAWLGTDELGRDLLSRVLYGGRVSLLIGIGAAAIACFVGATLGMISGYVRGKTEWIIMRVVDVLLGIPAVLLALTIIAVAGRKPWSALVAVSIVSVPDYARVTAASTLTVSQQEFVAAARGFGAGTGYVLRKVILPNIAHVLLVLLPLTVATAIVLEAALSFLGLGVQPPSPSWGRMLADGKQYLSQAPWYGIAPGVALAGTVLVFDSLARIGRRAFDSEVDIRQIHR